MRPLIQIVVPVVGVFVLLGGCRGVVTVPKQDAEGASPSVPLQQRIVVVVHGDASYLYHDTDGTAHQADEETLREAFTAARRMSNAEVFVFHQRPQDRLLGLIPRDDGTFYYFRRGRLRHQTTYDQNRAEPLAAEAALLRTHRAPEADTSLFTAALYYGHAVPEQSQPGYHRSRPEAPFGIESVAQGIDRMAGSEQSLFDAVVLSTCDGGTPHTLAALAPHARSVLAAPGDLHLSFIDADLLPSVADATEATAWTQRLAEQAFDRLTARVTTAVTLATYDLDRVAPSARRMTQQVRPDTATAPTGGRHVDCRHVLDVPVDTAGVRVWHRPARFGPQADQTEHSGWGCVPSSRSRKETATDVP
jgi:hypothetical protein